MLTRAITGFFFVAAIIAGVYFDASVALGLFVIIVMLGVDEFYSLVKKSKQIQPIKFFGIVTGLLFMILFGLLSQNKIEAQFLSVPIVLIFCFFLIELFRKKEHPFVNIAYSILGIIYVILPFAMLYDLGYYNSDYYNYQLILGFFLLLWTNDTGAYLAGKFLGKHKLFERLSPKKTWEGSIGGLVLTLVVSYVLSLYFDTLELKHWMIVGGLIAVFGGLGDLAESMLKRSLNIKDSGNILPGHGGILDRFDGLLLAVPFVYTYLRLIQ